MAKKKTTPARIADLQQAEGAMAEFAKLKLRMKEIDVKAGDEAVALKEKYEEMRAPLESRLGELEAGLKSFALLNRTEVFGSRQSVDLAFGKLEFRKSASTEQIRGIKADDTLEKVRQLGFREAITVSESLNIKAMLEWTDERLKLVGRHRVEKESFRVVPHEEVSA